MPINKADKSKRNGQMAAGVQKHFGPNDTILVDGVPTKQPDVVARLQAPDDASGRTTTAEATFHKAVADEAAAQKVADDTYRGLKSYFLSILKKQPEVLADYGLTLVAPRVPTAAEKAAAVAKRKATVAARGPVGKRKRALVKAPATASATTTTPKS